MFGRTSDEVLKLVGDLVEKAAEIKQYCIIFTSLILLEKTNCHNTAERENDSFILNSSVHVLSGLILSVNLISMKFSIRRAFTARKICD